MEALCSVAPIRFQLFCPHCSQARDQHRYSMLPHLTPAGPLVSGDLPLTKWRITFFKAQQEALLS